MKRVFYLLLIIIMLFSAFGTQYYASESSVIDGFLAIVEAPAPDSIPIANRADLEAINNSLGRNYHLIADIDLAGAEWEPIGNDYKNSQFTGTFDGQGHIIRNLTLTEKHSAYGLFGYVGDSAVIKNVGLEDTLININSSQSINFRTVEVGAICSYNSGTITNCYVFGLVSASSQGSSIGGISSFNTKLGTIEKCYNGASVSSVPVLDYPSEIKSSLSLSDTYSSIGGISGINLGNIDNCSNFGTVSSTCGQTGVGGISGTIEGGLVSRCYNTGAISSTSVEYSAAGGICGLKGILGGKGSLNSCTIANCYNVGEVTVSSETDSTFAGGICGVIGGIDYISNCYNAASLTATSTSQAFVGGICGYSYIDNSYENNDGIISGAYWVKDVAQTVNNDRLADVQKRGLGSGIKTDTTVPLTSVQMLDKSNISGFNFDSIWEYINGANNGYPVLVAPQATPSHDALEPSTVQSEVAAPTKSEPSTTPPAVSVDTQFLEESITIIVVREGVEHLLEPPVPPQLINGRTMLPFRFLVESVLSGTVEYDASTRSIRAFIQGHEILMVVDNIHVVIDGEMYLGYAPIVVNGTTLVPLRAFETVVDMLLWDAETQTVTIYP